MTYDDIQKNIDIIYKAINRYEYILDKCNYSKEVNNDVQKMLNKELKQLQKYKESHPEYFI